MVTERSPLLTRPVPGTQAALPRSRSRRLEPHEGWAGRLSVYAQSVEFDTQAISNAGQAGELLPRTIPCSSIHRFDRDVILLRVDSSAASQPEYHSQNGSAHLRVPMDRNGVKDLVCGTGEIFLFSYGVAVMFGMEEEAENCILAAVRKFSSGQFSWKESRSDTFDYQYFSVDPGSNAALLRVDEDTVLIANVPDESQVLHVKLAAAHAVAQNGKLASYERAIDSISARVQEYPARLAETGSLMLSSRDILKLQGELFAIVSHISISTRVQNIPQWFWEQEHLEPVFNAMWRYLNMDQRLSLLNSRVDRLQEMYTLFRDVRYLFSSQRT